MIRRTKIVATIGPATGTDAAIAGLLEAGANVIRINASHGTPELRARWIESVRCAADQAGQPVSVLVDLQGPRIRVGELPSPRELTPGQTVVFAPEEVARNDEIPTTYADLAKDARVGARILLDDGLLSVQVVRIVVPRVEGRVVDGGTLTSHKGMNLPGLQVSAPPLTDKDRDDVAHAVHSGADYLALSFVRRADDLAELRRLVPPTMKLVAKIEKAMALEDPRQARDHGDADARVDGPPPPPDPRGSFGRGERHSRRHGRRHAFRRDRRGRLSPRGGARHGSHHPGDGAGKHGPG